MATLTIDIYQKSIWQPRKLARGNFRLTKAIFYNPYSQVIRRIVYSEYLKSYRAQSPVVKATNYSAYVPVSQHAQVLESSDKFEHSSRQRQTEVSAGCLIAACEPKSRPPADSKWRSENCAAETAHCNRGSQTAEGLQQKQGRTL